MVNIGTILWGPRWLLIGTSFCTMSYSSITFVRGRRRSCLRVAASRFNDSFNPFRYHGTSTGKLLSPDISYHSEQGNGKLHPASV